MWNTSKIQSKNRQKGKIETSNVLIHNRRLAWFSTGTSIKKKWRCK
jgi:hypothetical protein